MAEYSTSNAAFNSVNTNLNNVEMDIEIDNSDNISEHDNQFQDPFNEIITLPNDRCYHCEGFYGPAFEQPVCVTCHSFLYPDTISAHDISEQNIMQIDDEDSGNDEPNESIFLETQDLRLSEPFPEQLLRLAQPDPLPSTSQQITTLTTSSSFDTELNPNIVELLPPEVALHIFSYLDEISLWNVGNVCQRWRDILISLIPQSNWHYYVLNRWPLFTPIVMIENWYLLYSSLMKNSNCVYCIRKMAQMTQPEGEENMWRKHRLRTEVRMMRSDPSDGIAAIPLDSECFHWQATIAGPVGSPYEGGLFYLYIQVPLSYPMDPPTVRFITKIFHPNVSRHGDIGIDSINHNWSLALTISKVLISIQSLLTDPYCRVSMEPYIAELYLDDREKFEEQARLWTWRYAMNEITIDWGDIRCN